MKVDDIEPVGDDLKLYRDHFKTHCWHIDRANQDFICEYKDCTAIIKERSIFIMYENCEEEFNYCIKHGLQELHGFKKDLDEFEMIVEKFGGKKNPT